MCRSSLDSAADQFDVAGLMDQGHLRDSGLAACRALLDAMDPGASRDCRRVGIVITGSKWRTRNGSPLQRSVIKIIKRTACASVRSVKDDENPHSEPCL